MKRILLVVTALLCYLIADAQLEKGTQLIGASATMNARNNDIDSIRNVASSAYNLNLRYGRLVANNFAVGISVPLTYSRIDQQSELTYGGGPFIRYYSPFEETEGEGSKLNLLLEARGTYSQSSFEDRNLKINRNTGYMGGAVGVGVIYFFNESVGLETLADYTFLYSLSNSDKSNGLSLNIGFQIYLNKYGF
jgi:hypothetical protein